MGAVNEVARTMKWTPRNITVRVGCNLAYATAVPTPVLFVLKPRLEDRVVVMQKKFCFGIGLPSYECRPLDGVKFFASAFGPFR